MNGPRQGASKRNLSGSSNEATPDKNRQRLQEIFGSPKMDTLDDIQLSDTNGHSSNVNKTPAQTPSSPKPSDNDNEIKLLRKAISDLKSCMSQKLESVERRINTKLQNLKQELSDEFAISVARIENRIDALERRVNAIEINDAPTTAKPYDPEVTIVASGVSYSDKYY